MRKLFTHFVFALVIGLSLSFTAQAGRTVPGGGAAGVECACHQPAPPICYYDDTFEICSGIGERSTQQTPPKPTSQNDIGSLGLLLLTALYLLKRVL